MHQPESIRQDERENPSQRNQDTDSPHLEGAPNADRTTGDPTNPKNVLALQQTIGNRAVTNRIKQKRNQQNGQVSDDREDQDDDAHDDENLELMGSIADDSLAGDDTPSDNPPPNDAPDSPEAPSAPETNAGTVPSTDSDSAPKDEAAPTDEPLPNGLDGLAPKSNAGENTKAQLNAMHQQGHELLHQQLQAAAQELQSQAGTDQPIALNLPSPMGPATMPAMPDTTASAMPMGDGGATMAPMENVGMNMQAASTAIGGGNSASSGGGAVQMAQDEVLTANNAARRGEIANNFAATTPTLVMNNLNPIANATRASIQDNIQSLLGQITQNREVTTASIQGLFAEKRTELQTMLTTEQGNIDTLAEAQITRLSTEVRENINNLYKDSIHAEQLANETTYQATRDGKVADAERTQSDAIDQTSLEKQIQARLIAQVYASNVSDRFDSENNDSPTYGDNVSDAQQQWDHQFMINRFGETVASQLETIAGTFKTDLTRSRQRAITRAGLTALSFRMMYGALRATKAAQINAQIEEQKAEIRRKRDQAKRLLQVLVNHLSTQLTTVEESSIGTIEFQSQLQTNQLLGSNQMALHAVDINLARLNSHITTAVSSVQNQIQTTTVSDDEALETHAQAVQDSLTQAAADEAGNWAEYAAATNANVQSSVLDSMSLTEAVYTHLLTELNPIMGSIQTNLTAAVTTSDTAMGDLVDDYETQARQDHQTFVDQGLLVSRGLFTLAVITPLNLWADNAAPKVVSDYGARADTILSNMGSVMHIAAPGVQFGNTGIQMPDWLSGTGISAASTTIAALTESYFAATGGKEFISTFGLAGARSAGDAGGILGSLSKWSGRVGVAGDVANVIFIGIEQGPAAAIEAAATTGFNWTFNWFLMQSGMALGPVGAAIAAGIIFVKDVGPVIHDILTPDFIPNSPSARGYFNRNLPFEIIPIENDGTSTSDFDLRREINRIVMAELAHANANPFYIDLENNLNTTLRREEEVAQRMVDAVIALENYFLSLGITRDQAMQMLKEEAALVGLNPRVIQAIDRVLTGNTTPAPNPIEEIDYQISLMTLAPAIRNHLSGYANNDSNLQVFVDFLNVYIQYPNPNNTSGPDAAIESFVNGTVDHLQWIYDTTQFQDGHYYTEYVRFPDMVNMYIELLQQTDTYRSAPSEADLIWRMTWYDLRQRVGA